MSFRLKTIFGIAFIDLVLLAILIGGTLRFLERASERQTHEFAQIILANFAALSQDHIISADLTRLQGYAEALAADHNIAYVRILGRRGRVMAESGSAAALRRPFRVDADPEQVPDQIYNIGEDIRAGGKKYGRLEMGIEVGALQAAFAQTRRWSLEVAGVGMALVILFSTGLGIYLTRQLDRLREGAKRLRDGELGYLVPVRGRDELAETAQIFNDMSRRLLDEHNASTAREQELAVERSNQRQRLERLVAARTADLFAAEAQASMILESSAAGLCGMDQRGRIAFINPAACEMLGYPHDQLIGADGHQIWHYQRPGGAPYPDSECPTGVALHQGEVTTGVEEVFWNAEGYPIEVIMSTHPMIQDGQIIGVVLSFVDNTERKRAEERLQESEREFRALAENIPDNVARCDPQGRLMYINPAMERALDRKASQILGQTMTDYDPQSPLAWTFQQAVEEVVVTGEERDVELSSGWLQTDAGTAMTDTNSDNLRVEQVRMVAERGGDGEVVGVLAIGRDVTGMKRAEMAREAALREAERLAQTKSAFLANMSHEIRTPLNAVLGLAQLGLKESRVRKSLSRFASILDAGQLLLGLVNDILDFSKIEAGKLNLEPGTVELGQVVDQALEMVASRAWTKGLDIVVDEETPLPEQFRGDALHIVQVLVNLLSNAVKFTEVGGVYLGVRLDGECLVFTVTDTGLGMSEEQMQRLFTPFEQADGSTTRRFGGTGLGLAISRRLADLMGGRIDVRSTLGEGSEFEFRLPVTEMVMQTTVPTAEQVWIVGLPSAENLLEELARRGTSAAMVSVEKAFGSQNGMIVLPYAQLESSMLARAQKVVDAGRRLAVVTPPGGMYALPGRLRDRLYLLDWPPRARHVLRALTSDIPDHEALPATGENILAGIRVLAAEDNELNRVVLNEMLELAGAETVCVENGLKLVERLQRDGVAAYDIVVTDVQMPVLDGYQAARRIRELAPDLPIIGLTAHAMAEEKERSLASGMSEHIGKPVKLEVLAAAILGLVRPEEAPTAPPAETAPATEPDDAPIDWPALEANFPGKKDLIHRLAQLLLDTHTGTPNKLRALAEDGDTEGIAQLSHNLKGVAGNMMAWEVHDLAAELNLAAKSEDPRVTPQACQLADSLDRLLAAVTVHLAEAG